MVDVSVLVKSARERARMSARDLAARCGVSASTVTRIERGEINPTVSMLERLLDASGNELVITVEPRRVPPNGPIAARRDTVRGSGAQCAPGADRVVERCGQAYQLTRDRPRAG